MISISLNKIGKKFQREWIFRNIDLDIAEGEKLVILGGNGSGKSTLLQVISGFVGASEGSILFRRNGLEIKPDDLHRHISFASPYIQLIEEFTLREVVEHVQEFKKFRNNLSSNNIIESIQLSAAADKMVRQFSSGMKQRLKLGLAILADTPLLLLDEPVSNLDKNAIAWYLDLMAGNAKDRTVIVCSNAITEEYAFCERSLNVMDYKIQR